MDEEIKNIKSKISELESRLNNLEGKRQQVEFLPQNSKPITLREIIKGTKFKNGSEKIAAIVGYNEKILKQIIRKRDIAKFWEEAKFDGVYKTNLFNRAEGEYVRLKSGDECDLTQTGEAYFDSLIKKNS